MEITIQTYELSDIPEDLISFVERDYTLVNTLLNLPDDIHEGNNIQSFHENLNDYPPHGTLPSDLRNRMHEFMLDIFEESVDINDKYQNGVLEALDDVSTDQLDKIFKIRPLLGEQIGYFDIRDNHCKIYFTVVMINKHYYGSIFMFWNENNPDILFIQGITKFMIPTLINIFLPNYDKLLPRLNSVLEGAIESQARLLGAKQILTVPIGNQGSILEKHYGYHRTNEVYYPCTQILGRKDVLTNLDYHKVYRKYVLE